MGELFLASNFYIVAPMVARILHEKQKGKKVMFIATAAEREEGDRSWLEDDRNALRDIGLEPIEYTITNKKKGDFEKDFKDIQYVFVSGGNTFYLLERAQQSGFIPFITNFMRQEGSVYFGSSAGAAIAGDDIYALINLDDPEKAPGLNGYKAFSLIDVTILPHWGNEHFKDRYLKRGLAHVYNNQHKIIFLTDDEFLYTQDGESFRLVKTG